MPPERTIKAKQIVQDLRSRMSDFELTAKYDLSLSELESVLRKLVEHGALREAELKERSAVYDDPANRIVTRGLPRHYLRAPVTLEDVNNRLVTGLVTDLSENGFRARGLIIPAGHTGRFLMYSEEVGSAGKVQVEALCMWSREGTDGEGPSEGGFRIVGISDAGLESLRKIIGALSMGDRNVARPKRLKTGA